MTVFWLMLALGISLTQVGVGLAVGVWLERNHPHEPEQGVEPSALPAPEPATSLVAAPAIAAPLAPTSESDLESRETLLALREFAAAMQNYVTNHTDRMDQMNNKLRGLPTGPGEGYADLREMVAEIMSANESLKNDLVTTQAQLRSTQQELDSRTQEARCDALTGLSNRRDFDQQLSRRLAEWSRRGTPFTLLMIDVDHFKKFNDTHGHLAGDQVLRGVAGVLRDTMREMDLVARYGGEEFAVILPSTVLHEGQRASVRALGAVRAGRFPFGDKLLRVTASMGVAQAQPGEVSDELIRRADECLYASKAAGRNCAHFHDGRMPLPVKEDPWAGDAPRPAERRRVPRHAYVERQGIAPYVEGHVPEPNEFRTVSGHDISPSGLSFLTSVLPTSDTLVVKLGTDPNVRMMVCEMVYHLREEDSPTPLYRVGCRFAGRLNPRGVRQELHEPLAVESW